MLNVECESGFCSTIVSSLLYFWVCALFAPPVLSVFLKPHTYHAFEKMGSSHTVSTPTDEQQIRYLGEFAKTLQVLISRPPHSKRTRIQFQTEHDCLKFINSSRALDCDDIELVEALHDLITQHVLHWMPAKYQSEICPLHAAFCLCITKNREEFVLNRLKELGVDTVKMRPLIDAAYMMSLEKKPAVKTRVKRASAANPSVVWRSLHRSTKLNQQPTRTRESSPKVIYRDVQRPVIVEYIPCTAITRQRVSPPYTI